MRKFLLTFVVSILVLSCTDSVIRPKNLIEEDKMSEIIADFAIADQIRNVKPMGDLDAESLYILKKYGIKGNDFVESYRFYISEPKTLNKILDNAQEIIKDKTPAGKKYIDKKIKEEEERKAKIEKEKKKKEQQDKENKKKTNKNLIKKEEVTKAQ